MSCQHEDNVYKGTDKFNKLEFRGSAVKNIIAERVKYRCLKCGEHFTEINKKAEGGVFTTTIFPDDERFEMRKTDL